MINGLFEDSGFSKSSLQESVHLFSSTNENRSVYWLVIKVGDPSLALKGQADLFSLCKEAVHNTALDKNISLLMIWNTGGGLDQVDMKQQIMRVEEDPYFFKKYVLYFSTEELKCLVNSLDQVSLDSFLHDNLTLTTTFSEYKNNPISQESWQPLLYRISIKLPFISVPTEESRSLDSLFSQNEQVVLEHRDQSLAQLDKILFQQPEILDNETIRDMKAISLLEKLSVSQDDKDDS